MKEDKISKSKASRFFKVGKTILLASGTYALEKGKQRAQLLTNKVESGQVYVAQVKAMKEIVSTMGHLKGGMMKFGQMISITDDLVLPKEVSDLFKVLQKESSFMAREDLLQQFENSFGKLPEEVFLEFDYKPIAAASIGQVHRARLKTGEEVAVKIQYLDIENIVKNDLKQMDNIKKVFEKILPIIENSQPIIDELKRTLLEECDYQQEAKNIEDFLSYYKNSPHIKIPKVYYDFSTKNILTMEFMYGDEFDETLSYPQEVKDHLAQVFYDFHVTSLCLHRHIHADPQHGNYLFSHEGITLLDFGSTKRFSKKFIERYLGFLKSLSTGDIDRFEILMTEFNFFKSDVKEERLQDYFDILSCFYAPFAKAGKHKVEQDNPFKTLFDFLKTLNLKNRSVPDSGFILLDRANLGVYMKARKWDSAVDWLSIIEKFQNDYHIK